MPKKRAATTSRNTDFKSVVSLEWFFPIVRRFGPDFIRTDGMRLIAAQAIGRDLGDDEILGRHRRACQASQQSELPGMSHRIGERALKQTFLGHSVEQNVAVSLKLAARAYVLENGRIVMSGTGADLLHDDRVRQAYLGL